MIKLKYCACVAQPDGSEGTLTVEWFNGNESTLITVGCMVKNDSTFRKLKNIKVTEETKYYAYTDGIPSENSSKADISVYRFTKPENEMKCTVEDVVNKKVGLSKHEYMFVPCERPKFNRSSFLKKYSLSVKSPTLSPRKVCEHGKVMGLCKEGNSERFLFFDFEINRQESNSDRFYIEDNVFDKLHKETGPLLIIGRGERTKRTERTLVGYYRKPSGGNHITIFTFGSDTETIDVCRHSHCAARQTPGEKGHGPEDPLVHRDQPDAGPQQQNQCSEQYLSNIKINPNEMLTSSATPEHINWLTVGEALRISKSALEKYTQQVVDDWHNKLLIRLGENGGCRSPSNCNPPGSLCSSCDAWYKELCQCHGENMSKLAWNNTDHTKWAKQGEAWEVAKVFMTYRGQMKSQMIDAHSTDIVGLLNILRYLPDEAFPGKPVLRPNRNSIDKVSNDARNPWAHSPQQEMKSCEKTKAIDSLKQLLEDEALKKSIGNTKLEYDGIKNISIAESSFLEILARELLADVAKIKAGISDLNETSNTQEHEIMQLNSSISRICSSVEHMEKMLKENENINIEMRLKKLFETDASGLRKELQVKLTKLEKNQNRIQKELEEISEKVNLNNQEKKKASLQSCLPDFQDKVFGREDDIKHITRLIQHDKKPCVVLTGGPGFGKTTVAIILAHKIKAGKVVIFVNLREMRSIKDMYGALLAKVGQDPKEQGMNELIYWARSLKEEVLFILDNAENALQRFKDAFCDLLQELRSTNSSFIQFLITSRESFSVPQMVTCKKIKELSKEEGINVIHSMVSESAIQRESLASLADLCGGIPLALRIIGSLLDHVDVANLIQDMKINPMEILEDTALPDYHKSIQRAFESSFKRLDESKVQPKLVRLSVFRGSFTQQAAYAICEAESSALTGKILKELTDKSLLNKVGSERYEMHCLIQEYLKIKKQYSNEFKTASDNFVDYYVSLTKKGHDMFWSKDKFKTSMEIFRNDNINIENALTEKCYKEPEKMKTFFPVVWSISSYLETCISMEKLTKFLELCCTSAVTQNEKGAELEAQCLLGYYDWKRSGNVEQFEKHIIRAKQLYEEKDLSQSQKWFYKYSYGMFLDQKKRRAEAFKVTKEAAQIVDKNSGADLFLTHSQLGIIEKHRKKCDEAELWLKGSHDKRKELLGEHHILSIPKELGDLYLQRRRYEEALELYEKALHTYKVINMDSEKQCINLLKNIGACCFCLGKVEKSLEHLKKAEELSERRLEGDQQVKVLIYSEMANVYAKEDSTKPTARGYAQRALEMAKRIKMTKFFRKAQMEKIVKA